MTGAELVAALDELERRRRRDAAALRDHVLRAMSCQEVTISSLPLLASQGAVVTPLLAPVDDIAAMLRVSTRTVWRLIADGVLPAVKVAGNTRVRVADAERYVDELDEIRAATSDPVAS